jgi:aquaporin Z
VAGILLAMIYAGGPVSGGHFNPAVTLGTALVGKTSAVRMLLYMVAQVAGALVAALIADGLRHPFAAPPAPPSPGSQSTWVLEVCFTFALVYAALLTSGDTSPLGGLPSQYAGLAIASVVGAGACAGAVMNPAVASGLLYGVDGLDLWCFWLAPFLGSIIAALAFGMFECLRLREAASRGVMNEPQTHFLNFVAMSLPLPLMQSLVPLVTELIGTFMLVLTVGLTAVGDVPPGLPVSLMLLSMVYAGGALSGAHYNPAVTLGVLLRLGDRGLCARFLGYIAAQVLGGYLAALSAEAALDALPGRVGLPLPAPATVGEHTYSNGQALAAEVLGTAALVFTVLMVATVDVVKEGDFFGLAIGSSLRAAIFALGPISGGGFNPAVATGLYLAGASSQDMGKLWIYWVGPLLGAVVAAVGFSMTSAPPSVTDGTAGGIAGDGERSFQ